MYLFSRKYSMYNILTVRLLTVACMYAELCLLLWHYRSMPPPAISGGGIMFRGFPSVRVSVCACVSVSASVHLFSLISPE